VDVRSLAASLPITEMTRLATLVSSPTVLSESYEWTGTAA
jgi:hypothetical protein